MQKRISNLPLMAYMCLSDFINHFRKDERGLSGVVVAILLILVAVLAVVLIWGFLSGWLRTVWDNITGQAATIS
jgi:flagellin-like protein